MRPAKFRMGKTFEVFPRNFDLRAPGWNRPTKAGARLLCRRRCHRRRRCRRRRRRRRQPSSRSRDHFFEGTFSVQRRQPDDIDPSEVSTLKRKTKVRLCLKEKQRNRRDRGLLKKRRKISLLPAAAAETEKVRVVGFGSRHFFEAASALRLRSVSLSRDGGGAIPLLVGRRWRHQERCSSRPFCGWHSWRPWPTQRPVHRPSLRTAGVLSTLRRSSNYPGKFQRPTGKKYRTFLNPFTKLSCCENLKTSLRWTEHYIFLSEASLHIIGKVFLQS